MATESSATAKPKSLTLPSTRVAPGHCVIIDYYDGPVGSRVAVVSSVQNGIVKARYLDRSIMLKKCWSSSPQQVTPISWFGVVVKYDGSKYWCEPDDSLEVSATYSDGLCRSWQERPEPIRIRALDKPLILAVNRMIQGD